MKRYLPFIIIGTVALLTAGAGTMLYRAKRPLHDASATSTSADKIADKTTHIRGQRDAPVTVEEFADFQCPSCSLVSGLLHQLEQEYKPRLRIVFRHFPLQMHSHAIEAAVAAEAAGQQGRFWEMHDLLYQNQSAWSKAANVQPLFETYAGNLGLDIERFKKDLQSREVNSRVASDSELGVSRGVKNTPTLFINGREATPPFDREKLVQAIEAAATAKNSPVP